MKLTTAQIELLEDLPLDGPDKWYTLLALTGQKKASWLHLKSDAWREGDEPKYICHDRITLVEQSFKSLGLAYKIKYRVTNAGLWQPEESSAKRKRYVQLADIFIATNKQTLDELLRAHEEWNHAKIGLALGYPETAVGVFGTQEAILSNKIESDDEFSVAVIEHTWFVLSKQHYKDELKIVTQWYDTLKQTSDLLLHELDRKYL